jgi:hypothetical protein
VVAASNLGAVRVRADSRLVQAGRRGQYFAEWRGAGRAGKAWKAEIRNRNPGGGKGGVIRDRSLVGGGSLGEGDEEESRPVWAGGDRERGCGSLETE